MYFTKVLLKSIVNYWFEKFWERNVAFEYVL